MSLARIFAKASEFYRKGVTQIFSSPLPHRREMPFRRLPKWKVTVIGNLLMSPRVIAESYVRRTAISPRLVGLTSMLPIGRGW